MRALRFLAGFAVAVASLHETWQALRAAWLDPRLERWVTAAAWVALVVASAGWAGLVVYAADRRAGRVRRRVGVYERALARGGRWP